MKRSTNLDDAMIAVAKLALRLGYYQHEVAAYFGINQGRISEVNTGKRGGEVSPSDYLPPDFPVLA